MQKLRSKHIALSGLVVLETIVIRPSLNPECCDECHTPPCLAQHVLKILYSYKNEAARCT